MKIKAIGFDIGGTLVDYNKPFNWSASYEEAIRYMCQKNEINLTEKRIENAKEILTKYNTRVNPREKEVSANVIFGEILEAWGEDLSRIKVAKKAFFEFFQREADVYPDAEKLLKYCKENGIKCAVYTDVAYGMDDEFALQDIAQIAQYIDLKFTSGNVGYRKPHRRGFELMLEKFECQPNEMLFVGDEKKDIQGAKSVGAQAILINRGNEQKDFGQDYTITKLGEIIEIVQKL